MDINKENTKYLASLLANCGATQDEINDLSFDDEVGFFESNRLADWFVSQINFGWRVWQAAKAHEAEKLKGCVLVPVQCPDPDFADSLFDELSKKAIGEFGDDLLIHFSDIDEEKIWALMVEAAKAQAVPEGFVLVLKDKISHFYQDNDEPENFCNSSNDWDCLGDGIDKDQIMIVNKHTQANISTEKFYGAWKLIETSYGTRWKFELFKSESEAKQAMIEAQEQSHE